MHVLDLGKVWEHEQDKKRFIVTPEEAWLTFEWNSSRPLSMVWEYLITPRLEQEWAGSDMTWSNGRILWAGASKPKPLIIARMANFIFSTRSWIGNRLSMSHSNKILAWGSNLSKPDGPTSEELKQVVIGAYNQVAAGLIQQLEMHVDEQPTNLS